MDFRSYSFQTAWMTEHPTDGTNVSTLRKKQNRTGGEQPTGVPVQTFGD